jgi:hypothetical protein
MAITAIEVPRTGWPAYFRDLGKLFQGWAVTVEVLDRQLGDQPVIDGLPFQGISYETKGGSQAGDVLIEAGDAGTPYLTHLVHRPRAVRGAALQPGVETDVEIDAEDGVTHIVRLRVRPELPPPDKREGA